jgi:hypothetical protein
MLSPFVGPSHGRENVVGHDEVCAARAGFRVSRHEGIRHQLTAGLKGVQDATVMVEPFVMGFRRRNDIREMRVFPYRWKIMT